MFFKAEIMDSSSVIRSLVRIAHEITEKNKGTDNLILIGIRRRGVPIAKEIAKNIGIFEDETPPVGELDIRHYRDDLTEDNDSPVVEPVTLPFDVTGKNIVLVDDVIYTGRTVRAAIEAIFSLGRPGRIQLAVLVDRGHRELPIRPDFVGKNVPTANNEVISVQIPEYDGKLCVELYQN